MTRLSKQDYMSLASFRKELRKFLRRSEEYARNAGITPQQYLVLLAVKGQDGRDWASINEIGEILQLKHNAVVGLVDRCQAANLVRREIHSGDRRVVMVTLTVDGDRTLEEIASQNLAEIQTLGPLVAVLNTV